MTTLLAFWKRMTGSQQTLDEFEAELAAHVAMHVDDGIRAGLTEDEARRQALIRLGGAEQTRQAYRERSTLPLIETVWQDMRFALRQMRTAPGFTLTAVLTLALGIGANVIIYTLVDSILLRPLPYADQDRLMRITATTAPGVPKGWVRALAENAHSFSALSAVGEDAESNISDSGSPERVFGAKVTVNAFDVLGIRPALGSFFTKEDAVAGEDNDVVLGYGYWRQHYGGSTDVVGRTLRIDGVSRRVIGVMPAGVHFPYADTQLIVPVSFHPDQVLDPWSVLDLHPIGRLASGVSPAQAQAELRRLHGMLLTMFPFRMPDIWDSDMTVVPLLEAQTGAIRPRLLLLFGAVGLILLIACANVANLMLARATAREREIAIRGALGASGRRLIQQLLCESVVLGVVAGVVGLLAALASLRIFVSILPADTPRIEDISLHANDLLFAFGASVLAGILFGLIPSIKMASRNLLTTLRAGTRTLIGKGASFGLSMTLVMAQIGLSVVVITVAGLMLHSLLELSRVDPGFRTTGTLTAEVALDKSACSEKGRCHAFFETLLQSLSSGSGLEGAAIADALPFGARENNYVYDAEGHPRDARQGARLATGRTVTPGYFDVLDLHLVRGRLLTEEDASGATHAVVINEHLAQKLWPNENPIGKHLLDVNDAPAPAVWDASKASIVVGVVRNARSGNLADDYHDQVYLPMTATREQAEMYVLLRARTTPTETAATLRRAVASIDSLVPVTRVRSMSDVVANSVAAPRALAMLLFGFGCLAVVIGAVGVYSLIAYMVSWRTREIGLRLALGAQRWQIVFSVVRQSLLLAGGGCILGLAGAIALSRVLRAFLFEVSVLDPMTISAVALLMIGVALVAAWYPARRAAGVDPMVAMRGD